MDGNSSLPRTIVGLSPDHVAQTLKDARDDVQNKLNILMAKQQAYDDALKAAAAAKQALDACVRSNGG